MVYDLKKCIKCLLNKAFTDFYIHEASGRRRNVCKTCHNPKKEWGKDITLTCVYEFCGNQFVKRQWNQKYCSDNCNSNAYKHRTGKSKTGLLQGELKKCLECKTSFKPPKKAPFSKFCSRRCSNNNRQRQYRKQYPEKLRAIEQRRYSNYREKRLAYSRDWGKTPKGHDNKLKHTRGRQARMHNVILDFKQSEWNSKIQDGICSGYNNPAHFVGIAKLEMDHIYPLSKANTDFLKTGIKHVYALKDVQPLCRRCNGKKWAH